MDKEFDIYIDKLNVQDVLSYAGYKFSRRDGLRYPAFIRLDSDGRRIHGDKFIVMPGNKCCFKPPVMRAYNIVSLITEFPETFPESAQGKKGGELVKAVCRRILNMPEDERGIKECESYMSQHKPFDIKNYRLHHFSDDDREARNKFFHYFNHRGIQIMTQSMFQKHFCLAMHETDKGKTITNLSFPLRIPGQMEIVGFEERGRMRLDGSGGYKGKAAGSNASLGLWIASPNDVKLKDAKDVYWFESAYDAMAYFQTHIKKDFNLHKAVFLSTGGTPTVGHYRGVLREAPQAMHHLCFDNDMAGKQFIVNFQNIVKSLRESTPKYGRDMKEYMATIKDGAYLKGDTDYLPEKLRKAYDKYYDEAEELMSMKECGLSAPCDIKDQQKKVNGLYQTWRKMMEEKLCIGRELGPLQDLGTYDIPEWAINMLENGDCDDLSEEDIQSVNDFLKKTFPEGFLMNIDWENYTEFNRYPAFGPGNKDALTSRGESPYLATKTYSVQFLHPTKREVFTGEKPISYKVEVPKEGFKDWNEELLGDDEKNKGGRITREIHTGVDLDGNGEEDIIETEENVEEKKQLRMGRHR